MNAANGNALCLCGHLRKSHNSTRGAWDGWCHSGMRTPFACGCKRFRETQSGKPDVRAKDKP